MIEIRNESCLDTVKSLPEHSVDIVLTSPFYNTARQRLQMDDPIKAKKQREWGSRYDTHIDSMTDEDYCDFTVSLFNGIDRILVKNGVVLYNLSYGNESANTMFLALNSIITQTPFMISDVIVWKKKMHGQSIQETN